MIVYEYCCSPDGRNNIINNSIKAYLWWKAIQLERATMKSPQ